MLRIALMASVLLSVLACAPTRADDKFTRADSKPSSAERIVSAVFSEVERQIIAEYFHKHGHSSRKGKGKGKPRGLPPGIAKNLRHGKPLPPGIAKQYFPAGLIDRLPPAPRGFERIIVGGKIILVEVATQIIHDVLTDAVFPGQMDQRSRTSSSNHASVGAWSVSPVARTRPCRGAFGQASSPAG